MKNLFATAIGTSVLTAGILSMSALGASAATLIGTYDGNDTGAQGTGITNLDSILGPAWTLAGKSDEGLGTFSSGGEGSLTGTWLTGLSGAGAFSVKAADGYLLFETDDISTINWSTLGLLNKGGQQPGLSHLSVYQKEVPEPLTLLGSGLALGFGGYFQKKRNAKKSAQ
ncbi:MULTISPECIES: PEP-CTERM sorting domain-containing protein [Planktothricoides]|uniref:PEP-CTERM sorting domain-containing protein n=2 Tax=Planktothricoides raciborskii TaxID=132608 RepID=A0AAU8JHS7_9CYAN|nr:MULTISPECIES: PEP-CTERM sorting domain-containing protein [Planktothricoides]KOR35068.1 hypothetical protein AM228_20445 [Planktothricoides sp. SR001]MBD2545613.1 PEP-CTERM sorting domain-containing protein [Planktothricoides raciborskii FACHB-1370]MBD2584925.1 PEP-CTERM sorting domain-containing protein [Planktothricoides raciborskii FACHB-1261]